MLLPSIIFLAILGVYPFCICVYTSFFQYSLTTPECPFIGLTNFFNILKDSYFWESLKTTGIFVLITVTLEFFIGLILAIILFKEFRGKDFIRTLIIVPMVITPVVTSTIWKLLFHSEFHVGLINFFLHLIKISPQGWLGSSTLAFPSIIIIDIWRWSPFMALISLSGLQSLSKEPLEAAAIDGASELQIMKYIILPLLKPIIGFAILFKTIWSIKAFDIIFATTRGGPGTVTQTFNLYIFLQAFNHFEIGYASALALILVFFTILVVQPLYRYVKF